MIYNFYCDNYYVGRLMGPHNFNIEGAAKLFLLNRYGCNDDVKDFMQHLKDKYDFTEITYKAFDIGPYCGMKE